MPFCSLPPPSNLPTGELLIESLERAADLIVKCLRACRRPEFYQVHTDRSSWEGAPVDLCLQALLGTLKDPEKIIGI